MRIVLAQLNCVVGDTSGNAERVITAMRRAAISRADLLVPPELAITGYPPEDLLNRRDFVDANLKALRQVVAASRKHPKLNTLVGYVDRTGSTLRNAVALAPNGTKSA